MQFSASDRHEHTSVPRRSSVDVELFAPRILSSFPPLCLWCFSEGCGKCECSDVPFCISFIFKNLCTMFSKKGLQVLDKKGEQVHPCAILSRCCSVVLPASASSWQTFETFLPGSVADEPGSRLDVVCTAGMLLFKQLARLVIAAGEEGFTELRVARSCVGRTNLNSQVRWSTRFQEDHTFYRIYCFPHRIHCLCNM